MSNETNLNQKNKVQLSTECVSKEPFWSNVWKSVISGVFTGIVVGFLMLYTTSCSEKKRDSENRTWQEEQTEKAQKWQLALENRGVLREAVRAYADAYAIYNQVAINFLAIGHQGANTEDGIAMQKRLKDYGDLFVLLNSSKVRLEYALESAGINYDKSVFDRIFLNRHAVDRDVPMCETVFEKYGYPTRTMNEKVTGLSSDFARPNDVLDWDASNNIESLDAKMHGGFRYIVGGYDFNKNSTRLSRDINYFKCLLNDHLNEDISKLYSYLYVMPESEDK